MALGTFAKAKAMHNDGQSKVFVEKNLGRGLTEDNRNGMSRFPKLDCISAEQLWQVLATAELHSSISVKLPQRQVPQQCAPGSRECTGVIFQESINPLSR